MNKLNELLQELCPNGIEYRKLREIASISRGGSFQKKDFKESGVPCIHYGQIYTKYGLFADTTFTFLDESCAIKQKKALKNDIVMAVTSENIEDVCKCLAWLGDEEVAISGHTAIIRHTQNPKYLVYYFHSAMFFVQKRKLAHGTKVMEVTPDKLNDIVIPIPPLEIQNEIVRMLDSFTLLTNELAERLATELVARQKQYEYYRDTLISKDKTISLKSIETVCKVSAGGDAPKDTMSREKTEEYTIPIISNGVGENALYGYTNEAKITEPAVTVAARGTIGYAEYRDYPYVPIIRLLSLMPIDKDELDTKYLYYCLQGKEYNVPTTGISQLTAPMVKQVEIPVPEIEVQKRIVDVLDNLDKICTDLNIGLPAEINARQKQYEFYRDQLLTFAETGKSILTDRA